MYFFFYLFISAILVDFCELLATSHGFRLMLDLSWHYDANNANELLLSYFCYELWAFLGSTIKRPLILIPIWLPGGFNGDVFIANSSSLLI